MIVECPQCESKVDAGVLAEAKGLEVLEEDVALPYVVSLVTCPSCKEPLLHYRDDTGAESRVWPPAETLPHWMLPPLVRDSLTEAQKCFKATAFIACAVMCGRALEAVGRHFKPGGNGNLGWNLRELKTAGIIDERILTWGEALRRFRNIGAHPSDEKIDKEDARDLLDFATAICDYVFVLTKKFDEFRERQNKKSATVKPK